VPKFRPVNFKRFISSLGGHRAILLPFYHAKLFVDETHRA
jgi:hypothetical protein